MYGDDVKKYSTLHPLYLSFYSRSLYRDVGRNWKGITFLYLLLLLAVCWIPIMFKMHSGIAGFIDAEAPKVVRQVPMITIEKGEVLVDADMPYIISDPDHNTPLIIIDTTGVYTDLKESDARVLLTRHELIMRKNASKTEIFDLSGIDDFVITKKLVYEWIDLFKKWFAFVLYPFAVLGSYLYRLVQVVIYSLIGVLIVRALESSLEFPSLLSLAIVADTPSIILNTIYNYVGLHLPFPSWGIICFAVTMGYLVFGIKANTGDVLPASPEGS